MVSNLRPLRLGEEKKEEDRKKLQDENLFIIYLFRNSQFHMQYKINIMVCPIT